MTDSNILEIISHKQAKERGLPRYYTGKPCKRGHYSERFSREREGISGSGGDCCECHRLLASKNNKKHNEKYRGSHTLKYLYTVTKCRARKFGVPFTITEEDIEIPERCPCCDVKLVIKTKGKREKATPSIDKINNNAGYIPGNVSIICWRCNFIKRDATIAELRKIADWMESKIKLQWDYTKDS